MEGATQEFQVEARGKNISATAWMPHGCYDSIEAAKDERDFLVRTGYGARILGRQVTPWRVVEEEGK